MQKTRTFVGLLTVALLGAVVGAGSANAETSDFMHYEEVDGINTITVCDIYDRSKCITLMDRNLGATKAGTGCSATDTGACGEHFQWGNNYGFAHPGVNGGDAITDASTTTKVVRDDSYNNSGYYGTTFIRNTRSPYDYWSDNQLHNGLRGGADDDYTNYWGYDTDTSTVLNVENRQGPCPDGYHVPSAGELSTLLRYRFMYYSGAGLSRYQFSTNYYRPGGLLSSNGITGLNYTYLPNQYITQFQEDFMIPYAGRRFYDVAKITEVDFNFYFWSSSPDFDLNINGPSKKIQSFYKDSFYVGHRYGQDHYRASAYSVRCFKNSNISIPYVVVYDGDEILFEKEVEKNTKLSEIPELVELLDGGRSKSGYRFLGWFDENGDELDMNTSVQNPIKIFAKYKNLYPQYVVEVYDGDEILFEKEVEKNTKLSEIPELVELLDGGRSKSGYRFLGWFDENGDELDMNTSVQNPIKIFAMYIVDNADYIHNVKVDGVDTISICDPSDHTKCITMQDRNLGATTNDITSVDSYGYHYMWGNNYGFPIGCFENYCRDYYSYTRSDCIPRSDEYIHVGYYRDTIGFCNELLKSFSFDDGRHPELWGGENDSQENNWGFDEEKHAAINPEYRRGPCDTGYHVPSYGEWKKLAEYWSDRNDVEIVDNYYWGYSLSGAIGFRFQFQEDFKIPFAGFRDYDGYIREVGVSASLSQTSLMSDIYDYIDALGEFASPFSISPFWIGHIYDGMESVSVRCFKDSYLSFNTVEIWAGDEDVESVCSGEVASGEKISGDLLTCINRLAEEGYILSGFLDIDTDELFNVQDPVVAGLRLKAEWKPIEYSIEYYLVGGEIETGSENPTNYTIKSDAITLNNPIREGYTFLGWTGTDLTTPKSEVIIAKGSTGNRKYYANRKENQKPVSYGGGGGGGGGSSLKKDTCPNGDYSDSYYDGKCGTNTKDSPAEPQNDGKQAQDYSATTQNDKSGHNPADELVYDTLRFNPHYSDEMNKAYQFAYHYGITTKDSISSADMNGNLTRIAMAKMLSQYAINILGMEPDESRTAEFSDVDENLDSEYGDGVSLAYKLGIMGINMPDERFRPFDLVTRAEFVTALSRMKYGTPDGKEKYYSTHMELLNKLGIISVTDPDMKELRGYVMLMLMRSAK